jgi:hypothetical protein
VKKAIEEERPEGVNIFSWAVYIKKPCEEFSAGF